ncbi:hypothetical protein OJF2_62750 [Aquisphaera giovannonii]|uniref:Uncharacterized protein n=1 Tax=Aquisphaera giovannonii TaxID=406548 RepID=A0A5B9WBN6_9BACT|nr:hypothetical protein [Aquisphaera giovannonii]QEH37684.1 hypothetical protein OJF2_62750 [Aquisphaera giovannonii]
MLQDERLGDAGQREPGMARGSMTRRGGQAYRLLATEDKLRKAARHGSTAASRRPGVPAALKPNGPLAMCTVRSRSAGSAICGRTSARA